MESVTWFCTRAQSVQRGDVRGAQVCDSLVHRFPEETEGGTLLFQVISPVQMMFTQGVPHCCECFPWCQILLGVRAMERNSTNYCL